MPLLLPSTCRGLAPPLPSQARTWGEAPPSCQRCCTPAFLSSLAPIPASRVCCLRRHAWPLSKRTSHAWRDRLPAIASSPIVERLAELGTAFHLGHRAEVIRFDGPLPLRSFRHRWGLRLRKALGLRSTFQQRPHSSW